MACILHPECNFLHCYLRCLLPVKTVDIELKVKRCKASIHLGEIGHPGLLNAIPGAPGSVHATPYLEK